jgi:hypothetical protein
LPHDKIFCNAKIICANEFFNNPKNIGLMGLVEIWQILCEKVLNKTLNVVDGASFVFLSANELIIINN